MLYYVMCTFTNNRTRYYSYYSKNENTSWLKWKWLGYRQPPTFMNIFKAKQIIAQLRARDIERNELDWYTYTIIPVLRFTHKDKLCK